MDCWFDTGYFSNVLTNPPLMKKVMALFLDGLPTECAGTQKTHIMVPTHEFVIIEKGKGGRAISGEEM